MSKEAISYLNENKDKFSKEVLIRELKKAGYSNKDILDSGQAVYGSFMGQSSRVATQNFWDFKSVKDYDKTEGRLADFLFGLIIVFIIGAIMAGILNEFFGRRYLGFLIVAGLEAVLAFYLFNIRRFISIGVIAHGVFFIGVIINSLNRLF